MKNNKDNIVKGIFFILSIYILKKMLEDWETPVNGKFTSGFGYRIDPVTKQKKFHNGQDIAVPIGTPIKAPNDGIVILDTPSIEGGNQMIIQHKNGWKTGYAHLSKLIKKKGDQVKKGEIIALSGNTGKHTTGAHLHFTLTNPQGVKVDPKIHLYKK